MSDKTGIEWTRGDDGAAGATWNPVTGCTKVSPGCDHCYAETFAERWRGTPGHHFENGFDVTLRPERLQQPLRWKRPRRVFVNSMSDLFHDQVPDDYIAQVFAAMALAPQHTFQLLTKRHARMRSLLSGGPRDAWVVPRHPSPFVRSVYEHARTLAPRGEMMRWPLPNLWLGVSVEDQKWANIRIPALLDTPAAVRFVSAEPLLGPVDLSNIGGEPGFDALFSNPGLDWVICGGESGPGARPMHPDWARELRDWCQVTGTAFFFKQWGEHLPVRVEDAPHMGFGRAWRHPGGGGWTSAVIRERGHTGTFRTGTTRLMRPGESNGCGTLLDADTMALRVGKHKSGRELDGRTWDEFPRAAEPVTA